MDPSSSPTRRSVSVSRPEAPRSGSDSPTLWGRTQAPAEHTGQFISSPLSTFQHQSIPLQTPVTIDTSVGGLEPYHLHAHNLRNGTPTGSADGTTMSPTISHSAINSPASMEVDYTTYPEVVESKQEWDSTPQVRTTQYFPEEYALSSKLVAEQQRQMTMNGDVVDSPVATTTTATIPPGTAGTATTGATTGAAAGAAASDASKALPNVPHSKDVATEGGSNKLNSRKIIYILIGLLILVIVLAGVIGGAVGSKAVSDARQECAASLAAAGGGPSPTSASSTTSTSPSSTGSADTSTQTFSVPTQGFVQLDCPSLDSTTASVDMGSESWEFDMTCGGGFSRGANSDIMAIISYSYFHCLQACASYNQNSGKTVCKGAEFNSDLSTAYTFAGNCFLSNSTSVSTTVGSDDTKNLKVAGVLKTAQITKSSGS